MAKFPQKIVCLTEESVETLFHLKREKRIVGVSSFVKRPERAKSLPKVSLFTSSNYKKIKQLSPDLIVGHSDIQKDIARDLIEQGYNVFIANHRSLDEILEYILWWGRVVDANAMAKKLVERCQKKVKMAQSFAQKLKRKPVVYFEEWDDPMISAIQWVAEIWELCGAQVIFSKMSNGVLAKDRFVQWEDVIKYNPDIIIGCWCGKKVRIGSFSKRLHADKVKAVKANQLYEVAPEIFLQPGPAPFLDGIDEVIRIIKKWDKEVTHEL